MVKKINPDELQQIAKSIPMLSVSASRLLHLTAQPDHEMAEVISLVKTDANLTARVLKIVNSAAFALITKVTTVDRAVAYLGERIIVGIALDDCSGKLFGKALAGYEAASGDLWKHDLRAAIASREVAALAKVDINPELAFTAGLLHDIGKAMISDYLQGTAPEAIQLISSQDSLDYLDAEEAMIGVNHTIAGYELAKAWQLPEELATVIRYHHDPANADEAYRALTYAVHLGDSIAMMGGYGTGADTMRYKLDSRYSDYIDINGSALAKIMLTVDMEFQKLDESFKDSGEKN